MGRVERMYGYMWPIGHATAKVHCNNGASGHGISVCSHKWTDEHSIM
jgi:hypothetical protein